MQQTRTHKAVTRRVEAKKLLSRRRQLEYRQLAMQTVATPASKLRGAKGERENIRRKKWKNACKICYFYNFYAEIVKFGLINTCYGGQTGGIQENI